MDNQKCPLTEEYLKKFEGELVSAKNRGESLEKVADNLHTGIQNFPHFSKVEIARELAQITIENTKKGKVMPFENVLKGFFEKLVQKERSTYHLSEKRKMG